MLTIGMLQYKGNAPWKNNRDLVKDINTLPHRPEWDTHKIHIGEGICKHVHIVFKQNILDIVQELIGNPHFEKCMRYALERHWTLSH
jgi:hypothetical protein